jgi:hypothetical protein
MKKYKDFPFSFSCEDWLLWSMISEFGPVLHRWDWTWSSADTWHYIYFFKTEEDAVMAKILFGGTRNKS